MNIVDLSNFNLQLVIPRIRNVILVIILMVLFFLVCWMLIPSFEFAQIALLLSHYLGSSNNVETILKLKVPPYLG